MKLYIHITVTLIFNFKLFLSFFSSRLLGNIKPIFFLAVFYHIFLSEFVLSSTMTTDDVNVNINQIF